MLNNLSEQVRECLEYAEGCARKAAEHPDGTSLKQDFLNLEKRWLELARSFQFGEQLTDFNNEANRKASARITPFLQGSAVSVWVQNTIGRAMRQMHSGIWRSLTRNRRLIPGGLGVRHPRASALTGRTELSFETRRLEWLTLYEVARALRCDYSVAPLAPPSSRL